MLWQHKIQHCRMLAMLFDSSLTQSFFYFVLCLNFKKRRFGSRLYIPLELKKHLTWWTPYTLSKGSTRLGTSFPENGVWNVLFFFFYLDYGQSPKRRRRCQQYKMFILRIYLYQLVYQSFKAQWLLCVPPGWTVNHPMYVMHVAPDKAPPTHSTHESLWIIDSLLACAAFLSTAWTASDHANIILMSLCLPSVFFPSGFPTIYLCTFPIHVWYIPDQMAGSIPWI